MLAGEHVSIRTGHPIDVRALDVLQHLLDRREFHGAEFAVQR